MIEPRPVPEKLGRLYSILKDTATDIREHMDYLADLAGQCEHVTEFGVRGANGSTIAFLAGQPKVLVSWDINPLSILSSTVRAMSDVLSEAPNRTNWQPRVGNTLEITTEPTDLLFIDTLHTFAQLKAELARHADPLEKRVRKFLVFHDTWTFGEQGEDGSKPGLRAAIRWFQRNHAFPLWELIEDRHNNNGLVVLKRVTP